MARITLYVPDDFKARMDAAGDGINWSEVARPALTTALAAFEHSKGRNMTTAIERLRASKREGEQNAKLFGNKAGRAWPRTKRDITTYGSCTVGERIIPTRIQAVP
jgi:hypothetical protein